MRTCPPTVPWVEIHADLTARDRSSLSGAELDVLAEAAWWLYRGDESIEARQQAYGAHSAARRDRRAAMSAWRLFHDHLYRGEEPIAIGWLRRARRHLAAEPASPEHGYVAFASAEVALNGGDLGVA